MRERAEEVEFLFFFGELTPIDFANHWKKEAKSEKNESPNPPEAQVGGLLPQDPDVRMASCQRD